MNNINNQIDSNFNFSAPNNLIKTNIGLNINSERNLLFFNECKFNFIMFSKDFNVWIWRC